MKNILILGILAVFMFGCGNSDQQKYNVIKTGTETTPPIFSIDLQIVGETTIQGCEYFVIQTYGYEILVHKGNCKNPIHHNLFDSIKYVDKIRLDSTKIDFLQKKVNVLERNNEKLITINHKNKIK